MKERQLSEFSARDYGFAAVHVAMSFAEALRDLGVVFKTGKQVRLDDPSMKQVGIDVTRASKLGQAARDIAVLVSKDQPVALGRLMVPGGYRNATLGVDPVSGLSIRMLSTYYGQDMPESEAEFVTRIDVLYQAGRS